jgi:CRISPR-associated protein Cmr1
LKPFSRPFIECFDSDWPHAIGRDEKGLLVWRTKQDFERWSDAIRALADIKIAFRTERPFSWPSHKAAKCGERHVLAYPVTNHSVWAWGGRGDEAFRLANQLCFKVKRTAQGGSARYRGFAFHLPHRLPEPMLAKLDDPATRKAVRDGEQTVWREVHRTLDGRMERCK